MRHIPIQIFGKYVAIRAKSGWGALSRFLEGVRKPGTGCRSKCHGGRSIAGAALPARCFCNRVSRWRGIVACRFDKVSNRYACIEFAGNKRAACHGASFFIASFPAPGRGGPGALGRISFPSKRKGQPCDCPFNLSSGKRDSDPRPQPWQGCALPTELFPQRISLLRMQR